MGFLIGDYNMTSLNHIENHLHPSEKRWFAIYTKYKCEKYVANILEKKRIEAYLPLLKKTKRYTRKIKHYEIPLINCYVFVYINKEEYNRVLETEYVMQFVKQRKHLISIPSDEINLLKRVVGEIQEVKAITSEWIEGQRVEVIAGQLSGITGQLIKKKGKHEFLVELENIGYQLVLTIDPRLLQPLSLVS
jgi:transcription antitermination factor NusG